MGSMVEEYTNSLYNEHKKYAAWWPSTHYEPGDFGELSGRLFKKIGNIKKDFGIRTDIVPTSPPFAFTYASKNAVDITFKPNVKVGVANGIDIFKGSMDISFPEENSIFIYTDGARTYSLDNLIGIFNQLLSLFKKGENTWKEDYKLITEVTQGENTTIYISSGKDAKVSLDAEIPISLPVIPGTPVPVSLNKPGIKLGFGSKRNIAFDIESKPGITPFMMLYQIARGFWHGPHWETLEKKPEGFYGPIDAISTVEDPLKVTYEEPMEILWFEKTP